mmetsp:Transcript_18272/g.27527  ORF Transcript_18272/g.27527 Transcript_18272/m.27527 type:complete len:274 (-) Transcript_18272:223-1044(-)
MRIGQPVFHTGNTPLQGTRITISLRNHPLKHDNIRLQVFNDGLLVQLDGTSGSRTFGGGITQFKCLFTLQIGKTFNLQNTAREDILLTLLLNSEKSILNCRVGDGLNQIPQGNSGLHSSSETNEDRLRHIKWEYTRGGSKGNQSTSGGEGDTQWETSVRISTSSHGVGNKHPIQPRVDDTITGTQTHTTPRLDKVGQSVMGDHIHRLGVCSRVTERLHNQIGRKSKTCQTLQLIPRHWSGRILTSHGSHGRFTILSGGDTINSTSLTHHLLRQ